MKTFAELQILGRVGKIKDVGTTLRVSIASEYGRKDDSGAFRTNPYWNEVTIFNDKVIAGLRKPSRPAIWSTPAAPCARPTTTTSDPQTGLPCAVPFQSR